MFVPRICAARLQKCACFFLSLFFRVWSHWVLVFRSAGSACAVTARVCIQGGTHAKKRLRVCVLVQSMLFIVQNVLCALFRFVCLYIIVVGIENPGFLKLAPSSGSPVGAKFSAFCRLHNSALDLKLCADIFANTCVRVCVPNSLEFRTGPEIGLTHKKCENMLS